MYMLNIVRRTAELLKTWVKRCPSEDNDKDELISSENPLLQVRHEVVMEANPKEKIADSVEIKTEYSE
jgi:hypothetical protein